MIAPTTKTCSACNTPKLLSDFNRNKARYDGATVYCRECSKQKWAKDHPKIFESMPGEVFKPIPGYESCYEASSLGRIRGTLYGRVLAPARQTNGYQIVGLSMGNHARTHLVHKLIAITFIGPRPAGMTINHIDGNKLNNTPENLEYCSHQANEAHAARLGLKASGDQNGSRLYPERLKRGEENHKSHFTPEQVLAIRTDPGKIAHIARAYGCSRSTVNRIKQGFVWKHI